MAPITITPTSTSGPHILYFIIFLVVVYTIYFPILYIYTYHGARLLNHHLDLATLTYSETRKLQSPADAYMRACWKRLFYKELVKNVLLILGTCSAIVCMLWYFHPELTWLEIARIVWEMRD
jgi:hypothetical protein